MGYCANAKKYLTNMDTNKSQANIDCLLDYVALYCERNKLSIQDIVYKLILIGFKNLTLPLIPTILAHHALPYLATKDTPYSKAESSIYYIQFADVGRTTGGTTRYIFFTFRLCRSLLYSLYRLTLVHRLAAMRACCSGCGEFALADGTMNNNWIKILIYIKTS